MVKEIEKIVNECLVKYTGGEVFFDAIDEKLRNNDSLMLEMINKIVNYTTHSIITKIYVFGVLVYKCVDNRF